MPFSQFSVVKEAQRITNARLQKNVVLVITQCEAENGKVVRAEIDFDTACALYNALESVVLGLDKMVAGPGIAVTITNKPIHIEKEN